MSQSPEAPGAVVRALVRAADRAALSTALADTGGWPYGSLVLAACDLDGSPLLLMSDLAEHARNVAADARLSLLYDGTAGLDDPLMGARATLVGRAEKTTDPRHRARYLARHPSAQGYIAFTDFQLYRVTVERAHLVAGFGRIEWLEAVDILDRVADAGPLFEHEAGIVQYMNDGHPDAIGRYARILLGLGGGDWRMTGIDPEGCDLRAGGTVARLPFGGRVTGPEDARVELVRLAQFARESEAD